MSTVPKGRAPKRKADELDTTPSGTPEQAAPQPKKVKGDKSAATPSQDIPTPTSRSGRVIKPKKFGDDLTPSTAVSNFRLKILKEYIRHASLSFDTQFVFRKNRI